MALKIIHVAGLKWYWMTDLNIEDNNKTTISRYGCFRL